MAKPKITIKSKTVLNIPQSSTFNHAQGFLKQINHRFRNQYFNQIQMQVNNSISQQFFAYLNQALNCTKK